MVVLRGRGEQASPERRAAVLRELAAQTPSEMADSELQVGPDLDADECDRDTGPWTAGFDSGSCLLGLYSAQQRRAYGTPGCANRCVVQQQQQDCWLASAVLLVRDQYGVLIIWGSIKLTDQ